MTDTIEAWEHTHVPVNSTRLSDLTQALKRPRRRRVGTRVHPLHRSPPPGSTASGGRPVDLGIGDAK
jgi:hypothetical protein